MIISLIMCAALLVMLWKQTSGYMVFGVREEPFSPRFAQHSQKNLTSLSTNHSRGFGSRHLTLTCKWVSKLGWELLYLRMKQSQHAHTFRKVR